MTCLRFARLTPAPILADITVMPFSFLTELPLKFTRKSLNWSAISATKITSTRYFQQTNGASARQHRATPIIHHRGKNNRIYFGITKYSVDGHHGKRKIINPTLVKAPKSILSHVTYKLHALRVIYFCIQMSKGFN